MALKARGLFSARFAARKMIGTALQMSNLAVIELDELIRAIIGSPFVPGLKNNTAFEETKEQDPL